MQIFNKLCRGQWQAAIVANIVAAIVVTIVAIVATTNTLALAYNQVAEATKPNLPCFTGLQVITMESDGWKAMKSASTSRSLQQTT